MSAHRDLPETCAFVDRFGNEVWTSAPAYQEIRRLREQNETLMLAEHRAVMANVRLGKWMSAALDDPAVCEGMKADIREWFSAGQPPHILSQARGEPSL